MSKPINSLTEDKDLENLSNAGDNTDNTVSHNLDKEESSTEKEVSDAHSLHHHHQHYHHNTDVIHDNGDGETFEVDWDTIERNYKHRHHHRSHSSGESDDKASDISHSSDNHKFNKGHLSRGNSKTNNKKKRMSKKKKIFLGILIFLLCVILGIVVTFFVMRYLGQKKLLNYDNVNMSFPKDIDYENNGRIVYYNGHTYEFNDNIASILFMGIDKRKLVDDAVAATAGQADALYLLTYDTSNGHIKVLCLNRDTMSEVIRYNAAGKYYDTETKQICLAYAYGDGKTTSAENQVTAVERLIYNIPINAYYAIDLSAIKVINDDIGGVTVTPEYTFGSFTKGQSITLKGDLTEEFVRHRDTTLLDDNLRRMSCQRLYLNSFTSQIVPAIKDDFTLPLKLYQDSSEYTVTNINPNIMTYLASSLATNYSGLNMITTKGEYKMVTGDASAEFKLDKNDFFEKILDIYYNKIK